MNRVCLGHLQNDNKGSNIHIIEFPKEKKQGGPKRVFKEIMVENVLNLARDKTPQIQETE